MKYAALIGFLVLASLLGAQELTAKWSSGHLKIGEQAELRLRLVNASKQLRYQPLSGEIHCEIKTDSAALTHDGTLEIIGAFHDTLISSGNAQTWLGKYTITAWDTGIYIFPLIRVELEDSVFEVQAEPLTVIFEKQKYNSDIEETLVDLPADYWYWLRAYWWIALFPAAAFVVWWIRKRNNVRRIRQLSLKERTRIALDALRKQEFWKQGKTEQHYIEFSFLLRSFLSARYELNLMERTTYETLLLLRSKGIPADTLERIRALLNESDMVKFAKGIPDEPTILQGLTRMEELIIELSPLDIVE